MMYMLEGVLWVATSEGVMVLDIVVVVRWGLGGGWVVGVEGGSGRGAVKSRRGWSALPGGKWVKVRFDGG